MNRELDEREIRPEWMTDEIARKMKYLTEIWINLESRSPGTKEYRRLEELEDDLIFKIVQLGEVHPHYDPLWMLEAKNEFLLNRNSDQNGNTRR